METSQAVYTKIRKIKIWFRGFRRFLPGFEGLNEGLGWMDLRWKSGLNVEFCWAECCIASCVKAKLKFYIPIDSWVLWRSFLLILTLFAPIFSFEYCCSVGVDIITYAQVLPLTTTARYYWDRQRLPDTQSFLITSNKSTYWETIYKLSILCTTSSWAFSTILFPGLRLLQLQEHSNDEQ